MLQNIRKIALGVAALAALALGGAALAGAADNSGRSETSSGDPAGHEHGAPDREALSSGVAAKVKAAALEKVPGATVLRVEAGGPSNSAYHAHLETATGARRVVLVNSSFEATRVQAEVFRGGRGGHGGHHGGRGSETSLTGGTKQKVEAAVRAEYPNAAIDRTETNGDSVAPYESHITTGSGSELEVLVSEDFKVVTAREHGAHP